MVSPLDVVTASATPPASQSQSPFFRIFPPEVRRIVYNYCACDYFADGAADPTALLKACKRTTLEATAPMQKYARICLFLDYDSPASYSDEVSANGEVSANDEGPSDDANASNLSDDGASPSRWHGVHTIGSAHVAQVEHVFIDLMIKIDDQWFCLTWEVVEEEPLLYKDFEYGMSMLNEFALNHGWDIKSASVDLGPRFDELVDRRAKFSFVKGFLEGGHGGAVSPVDQFSLFDRLVRQKAINFTGMTFSPFPIMECLNDPDGWEDDGSYGYNSYLGNVMGLDDPRFRVEDIVGGPRTWHSNMGWG